MVEARSGNTKMLDGRPGCFGNLDRVFPMNEGGLRRSSERCFACAEKSECLRAAVSGKNQITVEEEKVDRAYKSGKISFLQRWSRKKVLYNRRVGK